jgi:hypothetical protein
VAPTSTGLKATSSVRGRTATAQAFQEPTLTAPGKVEGVTWLLDI